ncbi:myelin expression factor 2 [Ditylenchus destructor]|nr:myelin expression factor 2 [Ditylenchus destructor]
MPKSVTKKSRSVTRIRFSSTDSLTCSTTDSLTCSTTDSLTCSTTDSLTCSPAVPQIHLPAVPQIHLPAVPQIHLPAVPQIHLLAVLQYHRFTYLQYHRFTYLQSCSTTDSLTCSTTYSLTCSLAEEERGDVASMISSLSTPAPPPPTRQLPTAADNETYGLSPAFLDQLNIKPPLVNRIFITNISLICAVGRIFDVCALAGKVTWLDLQLDKDGKSKGMAVVQYSHPIEAVQAVSMLHDQRLFDRALSVKMDRFDKDPASDRREGELPVGLRAVGMGLGANGAPLADVASVISSNEDWSKNGNTHEDSDNDPLGIKEFIATEGELRVVENDAPMETESTGSSPDTTQYRAGRKSEEATHDLDNDEDPLGINGFLASESK